MISEAAEPTKNPEHESVRQIYPPKPIGNEKKDSFQKSFLSLLLFIGSFYLLFDWELQFILILSGVLLIHELGHFLAMKIYNFKDLSIFFVPLLGAYASGEKDSVTQKQRAIIILAGPLPGVLIGTTIYYFGSVYSNSDLIQTSNIFIFLNLFNLLPIMPLDGGQLFKTLFLGKKHIINFVFVGISIIALVVIAIILETFFLLFIPLFLVMNLVNQFRIKKVKEDIKKQGIETDKTYSELSDQDYWVIRESIGKHIPALKKYIRLNNYRVSVNEDLIVKQVKEIVDKEPEKNLKAAGKFFFISLWLFCFVLPFAFIYWYHYAS